MGTSTNGAGETPATQHARADAGEIDLLGLGRVLRRRWWVVGATTVLALAAVGLWLRSQLPLYTAETLLQQQVTASPLDVLGGAASAARTDEVIASQIEILRSASVLGPVVDSLGLAVHLRDGTRRGLEAMASGEARPGTYELAAANGTLRLTRAGSREPLATAAPGEWLQGPGFRVRVHDAQALNGGVELRVVHREKAIATLRRDLSLQQASWTPLIRVRYTSPDPELAAAIVNGVAASHKARAAAAAQDNARRRREFLARQLVTVADSLAAAQEVQLDYQERAGIVNPAIEGQALIGSVLDAEREVRTLRYQESVLTMLNRSLASPGEADEALRRTVALGRDMVPGADVMFGRLQDLESQRRRLTASRFGRTETDYQVEVLDSLIDQTKLEMRSITAQSLGVLTARRRAAEDRLRDLQAEVRSLPSRATGYMRLQRTADAVQATFNLLAEKYYEAQIAEAVEAGDVEVVDPAAVPVTPDPTRRAMKLMLALMLGMVVGTSGALLLEQLDRRIRSAEEVERAAGVPVMARVPELAGGTGGAGVERPIIVTEARTPAAESFRTLQTMVRFARAEGTRVLAVTSASAGEGKSTIAANLALAKAEHGRRVLLIDADLPRPVQHEVFDVPLAPGLSDVLIGEATLEQATREVGERVDLITAGTAVPHSAELIGTEAFRALLARARDSYDLVLLDTPPVLMIADTTLIGTMTDGVLLVARAERTDRNALALAARQLRQVGAPLIGTVLNGVSRAVGYGYGYAYGYHGYHGYAARGADGNGRPAAETRLARVRRLFTKV
jgi:capsular exopolysaccharide synthesis family protein